MLPGADYEIRFLVVESNTALKERFKPAGRRREQEAFIIQLAYRVVTAQRVRVGSQEAEA
jgi:hypothetical protein